MPKTTEYRCPTSPRSHFCKKTYVSERWVKENCVPGTIRTTRVAGRPDMRKRTCRVRRPGPRGGRTKLLSLLKSKRAVQSSRRRRSRR